MIDEIEFSETNKSRDSPSMEKYLDQAEVEIGLAEQALNAAIRHLENAARMHEEASKLEPQLSNEEMLAAALQHEKIASMASAVGEVNNMINLSSSAKTLGQVMRGK